MVDNDQQKNRSNTTLTEGRGGGQGKPRTPSRQRKPWQPPEKPTTAANREKSANDNQSARADHPKNERITNAEDTYGPGWHASQLAAESEKFGHWELVVTPIQNGSCWEWTATFPDREDETGKQYQGASFKGRASTKEAAKKEAHDKAARTLLG